MSDEVDEMSAASRGSQRDAVDSINKWLEYDECDQAFATLRAARDEIVSLRAMLTRQNYSTHLAVAHMGRYAERCGFLQGGLEMVAAGHTTAERVLQSAREKYPDKD